MPLPLKAKDSCRWDLVSLGEVMLRFDPGDRRIWTTRAFEVSEGGGEYNVARGLKRCFGLAPRSSPPLPIIRSAVCFRTSSIRAASTRASFAGSITTASAAPSATG
jgi:hypothetical protein